MDPDKSRRAIDDRLTTYISWPNYHSGANGDFQLVKVVGKPHPVLILIDVSVRRCFLLAIFAAFIATIR